MNRILMLVVGFVMTVQSGTPTLRRESHDERGLSQSTENAILLAGAIVVAGLVVTAVTAYLNGKLPKL